MNCIKRTLAFLTAVILVMTLTGTVQIFAYEKPEHIRVGLYYGSAEKPVFRIDSERGLSLGYYSNREFTKLLDTGAKAVLVRKDTYFTAGAGMSETAAASSLAVYGPYHLECASGLDAAKAVEMAESLRSGGTDAFVASVGSDTQVWRGNYLNEAAARAEAEASAAKVVQSSANGIQVVDADTLQTLYLLDHSSLELGIRPNFTEALEEKFTVDYKNSYRGGVSVKRLTGGNIRLANVVDLEQYLYSVISQEMSPSWHVEALKAQAVCARNYAITNLNKHEKVYGVDLCCTVCCQAYPGIKSETEQSYAPVNETRGKLLTYQGEVAQTFYASSAGPKTEDVKNVWGSSIPYLISVDNPYEDTANISNGVWSKQLTKARATEIMRSKGYDVGNVTNIEAVEYTPAGRVLKLKVTGTAGEKIFEREQCRLIFSEATMSQMFTITGGGQGTASTPTITVYDGTSSDDKKIDEVHILGADGNTAASSGSLYVTDGKEQYEYIASGEADSGDPNTFTFHGQGWGHGIGMSQYGAKGMAENGFTYEQILTHYFTGTAISQ